MDGEEDLEMTWKVREKSGNLIINGYGSVQKKIFSIHWVKDDLSHEIA